MSAATASDSEISRVVSAAEQARVAGRREEANRLLSQAQSMAPDHPLVLNQAGIEKLHVGDAAAARQLLERAIAQDDKNSSFWLNLATAFRGLNLSDDEMKALDRVLALEPRHLLGLLQRGSLLERLGQPKAAAKVYQNALLTIPRGAKLPESLRPAIQRAMDAVRENFTALEGFLSQQLREVRATTRLRAAGAIRSLSRRDSRQATHLFTGADFRALSEGPGLGVLPSRGLPMARRNRSGERRDPQRIRARVCRGYGAARTLHRLSGRSTPRSMGGAQSLAALERVLSVARR